METTKHVANNIGMTGTLNGPENVIGSPEWIENTFTGFTAGFTGFGGGKYADKFSAIETGAKQFAGVIVNTVPEGYDRALALTKLREVSMYAASAIVQKFNS